MLLFAEQLYNFFYDKFYLNLLGCCQSINNLTNVGCRAKKYHQKIEKLKRGVEKGIRFDSVYFFS